MPELPEVEITRRGLLPGLRGQRVRSVSVRQPRLRYPVPPDLAARLVGRTLRGIDRRGKYLLLDFEAGRLLAHLGMSGSLRLVPAQEPADRHDHVDIEFEHIALRLRDPRRFGALLWIEGADASHPLLDHLGVEPLSPAFTPELLYAETRTRSAPIKQVLMDSGTVVGVGNIYACESLFRAGIDPQVAARRLSRERCARLVAAVRETLEAALEAGGSTLRDYVQSDGRPGGFQLRCAVYGRAGESCPTCATPVRSLRQGQRSTFFCPRCQR